MASFLSSWVALFVFWGKLVSVVSVLPDFARVIRASFALRWFAIILIWCTSWDDPSFRTVHQLPYHRNHCGVCLYFYVRFYWIAVLSCYSLESWQLYVHPVVRMGTGDRLLLDFRETEWCWAWICDGLAAISSILPTAWATWRAARECDL